MKHLFTILIALFVFTNLNSQVFIEESDVLRPGNSDLKVQNTEMNPVLSGSQIFFEGFDTAIPSTFTVIDGDKLPNRYTFITNGSWQFYTDATIVRKVALSSSWFTTGGKADDWLITPKITIGANTAIEWESMAYSQVVRDGYEVRVSTTGPDMASFETVVFDVPEDGADFQWRSAFLPDHGFANTDIWIAFRNESEGGNALFLDYIGVVDLAESGAAFTSVDIPDYMDINNAPFNFMAMLRNEGSSLITSIEVSYTVNSGDIQTITFEGLDLSPLTESEINLTGIVVESEGTTDFTFWVSKINGAESQSGTNYEASSIVYSSDNTYPRTVLLEIFTSSTCPPCTPGNINTEGIVRKPANDGKWVQVKYQMSWPGAGDPYFNNDGQTRRTYYNINSVPWMQVDGGWNGNSNSFSQEVLDQYHSVPAFVDLDINYEISQAKVDAQVTINSKVNISGAKLYLAVLETRTTKNIRTNGETEFFDVEQMMLPNGSGYTLPAITAGEPLKVDLTRMFSDHNHHVEDFNNLYVIGWIQDNASKNVYNAALGDGGIEPTLYDCEIEVINLKGTKSLDDAPFQISGTFTNHGIKTVNSIEINYSINGGSPVTATMSDLNVLEGGTELFIHPEEWSPEEKGSYKIEVWISKINGEVDENAANDRLSSTVLILGGTHVSPEPNYDIWGINNVYPNPANGVYNLDVTLDVEANTTINLYSLTGEIISSTTRRLSQGLNNLDMNTAGLSNGSYIIELIANGQKYYNSVVISR